MLRQQNDLPIRVTPGRHLRAFPGNHLEALAGDRRGQHGIRINDQCRICFLWKDGDAQRVEVGTSTDGGGMQRKGRRLPPVHPGEILREDLLKPLGISINRLGRDLRVPVTRMSEIVNGRRLSSG